MEITEAHNTKIAKITFATVYPLYIKKVEKKGRTVEELNEVITWLTGFSNNKIKELILCNITFKTFFEQATLNKNAHLITGLICGYKIETITNLLTLKIRYLDKLVDELAKGKKITKILRNS